MILRVYLLHQVMNHQNGPMVQGFKYLPIHNMSFQGKDGPGTLILKMIKENNTHNPNQCYTIELIIKRKEGEILEFKPKSGSQSLFV
jgi:hypothetical protein